MPMMAGVILEGIAQSGYGVTIGGFHCMSIEFGERFEELKKKMISPTDVVQWESEGHIMLLAMCRESYNIPGRREITVLRREPHRFFQDLPKFLSSSKAQFVDRMILSGSLGSISLTLLYRPAESLGA